MFTVPVMGLLQYLYAKYFIDIIYLPGMSDHTNNWGKRLSLFHPTVALNTHFDIYFTGVAPKTLRLHLLNTNTSDSMRVAI